MKLTSKGQVTIPQRLRKRYALTPDTEVVFEETPEGVLIRPANIERLQKLRVALRRSKGSAAIQRSAELLDLTRGED
ncbi:AbrB/MazE/SpoVT family DNA-binding domain-containing protein [Actomonas aquatica]|uniref:AbrB/MazE/SpoVT family DNA-binding domain-containing protein n=1 Tax=Actomonas aquatica TaxID=2866162 RepID=A0ABZ1CEL5_9BACT|nr:AbrB/MazE/SpoVT family DNA-binding domain-containing protein [Opitutus sp. WL0086]WRQ89737.1 AbrB/MazE/SpoVT family DNA-binding domain-containing protein [Opitutus sp. WL0086]